MTDEAIDVRCLPYMPLQIEQLRKSKTWLRCRRTPELAFYLVNLWMRAWHEVPAGSIEDDNDVLADAALCSPERWDEVREMVLEGWDRRDGRLWHRTVTDLATEAVGKLRQNRKRTKAAREALEKQRTVSVTAPVTDAVTETVTDLATETVTGAVTNTVTDDEGKGREEKETPIGVSKKQGSRLSEDWQPSERLIAWASAEGLSESQARREAEKFKGYWLGEAGQRSRKVDWDRAFQTWVRNAVDGRRGSANGKSGADRDANGDLTSSFLWARG